MTMCWHKSGLLYLLKKIIIPYYKTWFIHIFFVKYYGEAQVIQAVEQL